MIHLAWVVVEGASLVPGQTQREHRALVTWGRMQRHKPHIERLSGKGKYDLFQQEGREKVIDALEVNVWCIRRTNLFSHFKVQLLFMFLSYI